MQIEHLTQIKKPEIEKIIKSKLIAGVKYNLVSWKNWPEFHNTWLPETSITHKENLNRNTKSEKGTGNQVKLSKPRMPFQEITNKIQIKDNRSNISHQGKQKKSGNSFSKKIFKFKPERKLRKKQKYSFKKWYNLRRSKKKVKVKKVKEKKKISCFSFKQGKNPKNKQSVLSFQSKRKLTNICLDFKFELKNLKSNFLPEKIETLLSAKSTLANFNKDEDTVSNEGLSFSLNFSKKNFGENPFKNKIELPLDKPNTKEPMFYSPLVRKMRDGNLELRSMKTSPKFLKF